MVKPTEAEKEIKRLRFKIKELKKHNRLKDQLPEVAQIYKQQNDGLIGSNNELSKKNRLLKHKLKTAKETIAQKDQVIADLKKTLEEIKPKNTETVDMRHKNYIGAKNANL